MKYIWDIILCFSLDIFVVLFSYICSDQNDCFEFMLKKACKTIKYFTEQKSFFYT